MRLTVASAFRDAQHNVTAYLRRVVALRDLLGDSWQVRVVAGEGDSVDHTRAYLDAEARAHGLCLVFADCAHGGPRWGSTEEPERLHALSRVLNRIMDAATYDAQQSCDVLVYVEQDLKWDPQTLRALAVAVMNDTQRSVYAPLVMAGACFYDTWGFRLDSRESRFGPFFPYSHGLDHKPGAVTEVYSVGSCVALHSWLAREIRVENDYAFVGWCERARELGAHIKVRSDLVVRQA